MGYTISLDFHLKVTENLIQVYVNYISQGISGLELGITAEIFYCYWSFVNTLS